jgi:hypothetical protein
MSQLFARAATLLVGRIGGTGPPSCALAKYAQDRLAQERVQRRATLPGEVLERCPLIVREA